MTHLPFEGLQMKDLGQPPGQAAAGGVTHLPFLQVLGAGQLLGEHAAVFVTQRPALQRFPGGHFTPAHRFFTHFPERRLQY